MAAGLGFKTFTTGEVLTAADTNGYLMQGILVFATEAARNSAITSPQEGQFAFTKDTNSTWYYDGAAWVASGASGDVTGVTAGTGISVTNPTGPVPTVAIDTAVTVDKTTAQTLTNKTLTSPALTTPTISTLTTNGDLLYGTGSGALARKAIGTTGQVLTVASGIPSWATPSGGKVVQIITGSTTTSVSNSTSTFADSNLTATITPTSASNQVLIMYYQNGCWTSASGRQMSMQLLRDATVLQTAGGTMESGAADGAAYATTISNSYLDSPATTSATVYKTQVASTMNNANIQVQRNSNHSTIVLMEVTP